jgi:hypothetical protein
MVVGRRQSRHTVSSGNGGHAVVDKKNDVFETGQREIRSYSVEDRKLGKRYDGKSSPLGKTPVLKIPGTETGIHPGRLSLEEGVAHLGAPGMWSDTIQDIYDMVLSGKYSDATVTWADKKLAEWGYNPTRVNSLSKVKRMALCDKLVRAAHREQKDHEEAVLKEILTAPRSLDYVPGSHIDKIDTIMKARGALPRGMFLGGDTGCLERTELHLSLREWAAGDLRLEHPQASSWHHLMEYEKIEEDHGYAKVLKNEPPQLFVVERDWARAFAGYNLNDGDSPLPYNHCVFEFRISGVRVMAVYHESGDIMFCIYGRGGVWVCDDYTYSISTGTSKLSVRASDNVEFVRVAKLVRDNVRVACIMVDADIAEKTEVKASGVLIKKRAYQGKHPPRDHYVIDLKHKHKRAAPGSRTGGSPLYHQRGHFRRGTWVHYPDPNSGQVRYTDDHGIELSRTWRHWHFAGDPNNIIEREYRL